MNSFGTILAKYRKANHFSQSALAKELHNKGISISQKTLSSWESGRTEPSLFALFSLCQILQIEDIYGEMIGVATVNRLNKFNEKGKAMINDYMNLLEAAGGYTKEAGNIIIPFTSRVIRLFNLPVSAGPGQFLDGDEYEELTIDDSYPSDIDFAVHIRGDSMLPKFQDGQVIYIHKQNTLANEELGIFLLDGNAYVKKLQNDKKGIALISLNKKYDPIPVKEFSDLKIFGKVVL